MRSFRMKRWRGSIGVALAALALGGHVRPAYAWYSSGHMVIADIAYDHLTPEARARVDALLAKHRDYRRWMSEMPAGDTDKARFAFMKAATWPDEIRGTPDARPAWHFVDMPVIAPGYSPNPSALAVPTPNAETQIPAETVLLTQAGVSDADRAVALCWVEHLIGDLHQPLHAGTLFSPLFPQGDKGGNAESLAPDALAGDPAEALGHPRTLHALWDNALGEETDAAHIIAVAQSLETASYAPDTFPQLSEDTTVHSWVVETNALAQEVAYVGGTLPMTLQPARAAGPSSITVTCPPAYLSTLHAVANRQIALAGLRLAQALNADFARANGQ